MFSSIRDLLTDRNILIGWLWKSQWTGYKTMKNLIGLFDAICETYDDPQLVPKSDGTTFCNYAVSNIASAMGCQDLKDKTANGIIAFINTSPDWSLVAFNQAQDMANQGSLLIAGLESKDLNQSHGHVVVIRPGKPCYSGKWGPTPRCLNIGAENFIARAKKGPLTGMSCGLNEAFVEVPKIFVWRLSL